VKFFSQRLGGEITPVKSPVRTPSSAYLHVAKWFLTVSKLLGVGNHKSASRLRSNQLSYGPRTPSEYHALLRLRISSMLPNSSSDAGRHAIPNRAATMYTLVGSQCVSLLANNPLIECHNPALSSTYALVYFSIEHSSAENCLPR